eukprot:2474070-Amphidinium_carterae.2
MLGGLQSQMLQLRCIVLSSELGQPLPTTSGLDNSNNNVIKLFSFSKEYTSKLHPTDKLLNSELVALAGAPSPAVIQMVQTLRNRRR